MELVSTELYLQRTVSCCITHSNRYATATYICLNGASAFTPVITIDQSEYVYSGPRKYDRDKFDFLCNFNRFYGTDAKLRLKQLFKFKNRVSIVTMNSSTVFFVMLSIGFVL